MSILGQDKLLKLIDSYSNETFPRTSLLVGEYGCGKHTLTKYIVDKLHEDFEDITDTISFEKISDITLTIISKVYFIDLNKVNEKSQNIILKFIEEPLNNAHIILSCDNENLVLDTIINRCVKFTFEKYSDETLKAFTTDDSLLSVCSTPGQILKFQYLNINELDNFCSLLIDKLGVANYSNALSIDTKFNYKDDYDKFDVRIFFMMLSKKLSERYKKTLDKKFLTMYNIVMKYCNEYQLDSRLNKQYLLDRMITELWESLK